ncbi:MAG: GAF domain-containing protein, partial [Solirubrobacteraceae bacterium]|nr:GAF domain-containing protein [Solirubrobacteraceae bacterium]
MPTTQSPTTATLGRDTLYAVIGAIAEGPDLDRVLRAIVDLLVEATACHACFVYLREGDLLRIRAASPVFAHAVGMVALRLDEGLTGWVARHRTPAFIRDNALQDPRMKYVPELQEERFQSMVAVPLVDRRGDVIGVVVLHTEAPREFDDDVLELLVHVASLVGGAIDTARLYEQTRRQVAALEALAQLSQELASLTGREELYAAGCEGIARLLEADACRLSMLDARGAPAEVAAVPQDGGDALVEGRLVARLLDGERPIGQVSVARARPFDDADARLLEASANQLALALRKAELIERLAAETVVRDVFDALERGSAAAAAARARAAGWDPARPHVVVVGRPAAGVAARWSERVAAEAERRLRLIARGALCDADAERLRALVPLAGGREALERLAADLDAAGRELGVAFGVSEPRRGLGEDARSLGEAADAARVALALEPRGGGRRVAELGPYRYLVGGGAGGAGGGG